MLRQYLKRKQDLKKHNELEKKADDEKRTQQLNVLKRGQAAPAGNAKLGLEE